MNTLITINRLGGILGMAAGLLFILVAIQIIKKIAEARLTLVPTEETYHMTIQIRPAQTTDLPALVGLLDCLFDQESEFKPNPDWERAGLQMIMGNRAIGEIFVADGDGKVIGMVSLLYTVSTALGGKVALLEDVVVDPGHRHSGYGTRLVEHAIKHAKGGKCLRITLLTDSGNQIAQKFYQKFQFERSGMVTMRLLF